MNNNIVPLVSFPKSGNTWVRFLLANLFKRDQNLTVDFENINNFMPTNHDEDFTRISHLFVDNTPIFIKEHSNYYDMPYRNFKKAIYIYRDGFDSLYSYWHFTDAQSPNLFPNIEAFSNCYWSYCGHWGSHLYSWVLDEKTKQQHQVLAISYERLINDTVAILTEITKFLEMDIDESRIIKAVHLSDKKNMKKLSGSKSFMKSKKKDFHFVRSASKGDASKKLPEYCKEKFLENQLNYDLMTQYNYLDISNQWKGGNKKASSPLIDKVKSKYYYSKYRLLNR